MSGLEDFYRSKDVYIKLPTQLRYYKHHPKLSSEGELGIMPMSTKDEMLLKVPDTLYNGEALFEIIKSVAPDIKDPYEILLPDMDAGCSLSSSVTGKDVRLLKEKYPGVPVVSYVNTSAEVKAETDICCTSANAVKIVESLGVKKVIFLPDDYLAKYVASQTDVEIIAWKGICMVHDQFNEKEIHDIREKNPGIKIIAHPECPPEVIKASDFAGSTGGMIDYVKNNQPQKVMMVTECSMSDNIQVENPNVEFIRPCNLCPHMKKITLPKILDCLENETGEIIMDKETIEKARIPVERMAAIGR